MALRDYTYEGLQDAIKGWLNREDLDDEVPDFIMLAEKMMNRELRVGEMTVHDVTADPEANEVYENLPSDYLELESIRFNDGCSEPPEYASPRMLEYWRAYYRGQTGAPRFYTIIGRQLIFDRVPAGVELDISSFVKILPLSDEDTSNAILQEYPDLYLYGSLMQAEPFLKNDPRLATWTALYENGRDKANLAYEKGKTSPGPLVVRARRSF